MGPGLTGKAAQCTAPGSWLSSVGRGVMRSSPTLAPRLRTHGAVWDNVAAHKVGGYMVQRKEAELWCQEAAGQAAGLGVGSSSGCGAGLVQGDPGNSSFAVWGPSAQAGGVGHPPVDPRGKVTASSLEAGKSVFQL